MKHSSQETQNVCELLSQQNDLLTAILETSGVSSGRSSGIVSVYEYAAVPADKDLDTLSCPPGSIQFDFEKGQAIHTAPENSDFPDAGVIRDNIRKFDDMVKGVEDTRLESLRSAQLWCDVDGAVGFDRAQGGYIHLFAGLVEMVKSHGFKTVTVFADYPFEIRLNVSTRVDAFETSNKRGALTRRGELTSGTHDSYTEMQWWPGGLDGILSEANTGFDHTDYNVPELPTFGHDNMTLQVINTGANDIDARIQARDEPDESWYQIGTEITNIPAGDHTVFDVQEEHRELRAQVRNSTNGDTVEAGGQMSAGGT